MNTCGIHLSMQAEPLLHGCESTDYNIFLNDSSNECSGTTWITLIKNNYPRLSYELIIPVVQAVEEEHILSPHRKTVTEDYSDYQLYMVWGFFPINSVKLFNEVCLAAY